MTWTEERPGDGDLLPLTAVQSVLERASGDVEFLRDSLWRFGDEMGPTVWSGRRRSSWDAVAEAEYSRMAAVPQTLVGAAELLRVYRTTVEEIEAEVEAEYTKIAEIVQDARACPALSVSDAGMWSNAVALWGDVEAALQAAGGHPGVSVPGPVVPCSHVGGRPRTQIRDVYDAEAWARVVTSAVTWHREQILVLGGRRRAADTRLADGLRALLPTSWPSERDAFESAGITDPRLMVPPRADVGVTTLDAILSMAAGYVALGLMRALERKNLSDEEREALAVALERATAGRESDLVFWRTFYAGFSPDELPAALLEAFPLVSAAQVVDDDVPADVLALRDAFANLGGGLALYSGSLTYGEQSRLGANLTEAAAEERWGGLALSFLLSDPGMAGGVFAGAMLAMDRLERLQGERWRQWSSIPVAYATRPDLAESVPWDPALVVLDGLSRNPHAALDFFSPHSSGGSVEGVPVADEVSQARIEYWVARRNYGDGLTAVSAVIEAATSAGDNTQVAVQPDGSLADDTARPTRAAWTLSVVSGVLGDRGDLDRMSEDAALSLTTAFAPHFAQGLGQDPGLTTDDHGNGQYGTESFTPKVLFDHPYAQYADLAFNDDALEPDPHVPGSAGLDALDDREIPAVSYEGLRAIVGATTRHDVALSAWLTQARDEREDLFDRAFTDPTLTAPARRALVEQGLEVQSGVIGMAEYGAVRRGQSHDKAVGHVTTGIQALVGWLPYGGHARPLLDLVTSEAVDALTQGANGEAYSQAEGFEASMLLGWGDAYASLQRHAAELPPPATEDLKKANGKDVTILDAQLTNLTGNPAGHYAKGYASTYREESYVRKG